MAVLSTKVRSGSVDVEFQERRFFKRGVENFVTSFRTTDDRFPIERHDVQVVMRATVINKTAKIRSTHTAWSDRGGIKQLDKLQRQTVLRLLGVADVGYDDDIEVIIHDSVYTWFDFSTKETKNELIQEEVKGDKFP